MMTEDDSTSGNCCTGSFVSARTPTSTMIRLMTIARTGCLMKTSVKARMTGLPDSFVFLAFVFSALVLRDRRVGQADQRGFAQLERAGSGDAFAGLEPCSHDDVVAFQAFDRHLA